MRSPFESKTAPLLPLRTVRSRLDLGGELRRRDGIENRPGVGEVIETISVGGSPNDLVATDDGVWVTVD